MSTRDLLVGARTAGTWAAGSSRRLADRLTDEVAPHLPVRDLLTLREHHGGLSGDQLARALIHQAAVATAACGAAAGVLMTAELAAPPLLLTAPAQLTAHTLAVITVELKLVAELHVVYGRAPKGSRRTVAVAYLTSWSQQRAVGRFGEGPSLASVLSTPARQQLRQRVLRRLGRNTFSLVPLLAGAAAGAELNRRETRSLGNAILRDLRGVG